MDARGPLRTRGTALPSPMDANRRTRPPSFPMAFLGLILIWVVPHLAASSPPSPVSFRPSPCSSDICNINVFFDFSPSGFNQAQRDSIIDGVRAKFDFTIEGLHVSEALCFLTIDPGGRRHWVIFDNQEIPRYNYGKTWPDSLRSWVYRKKLTDGHWRNYFNTSTKQLTGLIETTAHELGHHFPPGAGHNQHAPATRDTFRDTNRKLYEREAGDGELVEGRPGLMADGIYVTTQELVDNQRRFTLEEKRAIAESIRKEQAGYSLTPKPSGQPTDLQFIAGPRYDAENPRGPEPYRAERSDQLVSIDASVYGNDIWDFGYATDDGGFVKLVAAGLNWQTLAFAPGAVVDFAIRRVGLPDESRLPLSEAGHIDELIEPIPSYNATEPRLEEGYYYRMATLGFDAGVIVTLETSWLDPLDGLKPNPARDPPCAMHSITLDRYADNFPVSNGGLVTTPARMDGAHSLSMDSPAEYPMRWVRSDSAVVRIGDADVAVYLRFRVTPGPCQPNLGSPFFVAYPPNQWHSARMDTAQDHVLGLTSPGVYMTCYHESDPRNGTYWVNSPPSWEPCDDILPDGLFTAGTEVAYFFEARNIGSGQVVATFPAARECRPVTTAENFRTFWLRTGVLPRFELPCDGTYANNVLIINDYASNDHPGPATIAQERLTATLASLGLDFDVYDHVGSNYASSYDGIGRREDRPNQIPRPPYNGATALMLEGYDCIWYTSGLSLQGTLSDRATLSLMGGEPSQDQQRLESWLAACNSNRLLVMEGSGWASDCAANTSHGPAFLSRLGVSMLAGDYARELATNDLRRCARLNGQGAMSGFQGSAFGSGCPENLPFNVYAAVAGGEPLVNFVESQEDCDDPVSCDDDINRPTWHAAVRKVNPSHTCERSVVMSLPSAYLYPLGCADECQFEDYRITGPPARFAIDAFQWASLPVNPYPITVDSGEPVPRPVSFLYPAQPNPAGSHTEIRYALGERGRVRLAIYDVRGRLVRTLVDGMAGPSRKPSGVIWDGSDAQGRRVSSGVYFYELELGNRRLSRKVIILE